MTLLDRNKRAPNPKLQELAEQVARHRPSDQPVELAAEVAERISRRAAANANARRRAGWLRGLYVVGVGIACCVVAAAIGGSGSAALCTGVLALTVASALMVAINRPARVRVLYGRAAGTLTCLHSALAIGALAGLGGGPSSLEQLRTSAFSALAGDSERDAQLRARLGGDTARLRALVAEARAAAEATDWKRAAGALAEAVVLQKPYQQGGTAVALDPALVRELESVAKQAAEAEHREQQQAKPAAQPAPEPPPKPSLNEQVAQLQRASEQADQLARAQRWLDSDRVYDALLAALDDLPPGVQYPAGFSPTEFSAQVKQRASQVRSKALYLRGCGDEPLCDRQTHHCQAVDDFLSKRASVVACDSPVLTAQQCWVTQCQVREGQGKRARTRTLKFSISSLGVQPL